MDIWIAGNGRIIPVVDGWKWDAKTGEIPDDHRPGNDGFCVCESPSRIRKSNDGLAEICTATNYGTWLRIPA